jgi:asparagine N-glycosylation enzyme membrane subunit Stt3
LKKVNPKLIIIPGHAAKDWQYEENEFIEEFKKAEKVRVLNTKEVGNIIITTDGRTYSVDTTKPVFQDYKDDSFLNSLEVTSFNYTKDGKNYVVELYPSLLPVMDWIRDSTPKQAVFLNWWDYGHMIRGVGERETILFAPSREILYTVSKYARLSEEELSKVECPDCNPHERIMDVVNALITNDPDKTKDIMRKYNAEYVLVTKNDKAKSYALFLIAGYKPSDYLDKNFKPKENAMNLVLFKMINEEDVKGFEKIYSDEIVKIYKIKNVSKEVSKESSKESEENQLIKVLRLDPQKENTHLSKVGDIEDAYWMRTGWIS